MTASQKQKVLLMIPNLGGGGAQRVASLLSMHLSKDVTLALFDKKISYSYGGNLVDLQTGATRNILKKITNVASRVVRVKKLKQSLGMPRT
ncbi:MAG: N-acetylgalactosamine-N, N-diacetylbacillosaminyl-diphospho-undecaprenol, partial [Patescibacteria group bacterium]|nr:N-acetylgalactosamine-N, N-diacetylbacillosaminyl-diphospho-undecaprenol [Patescibacteria group bacterium]